MRVRVLARIVASLMISASMSAGAVSISLQDSCSKSMGGSLGAGVVVDPGSGNLATTQLSATYTAGVGSCIPLAADNKPICVLSASETAIAVGRTISLYANCSSTPQSLAWTLPFGGPTPAAISGTPNAFSLTLPTTGVYTYAVTGSNGGGAGPTSTPVTILVGDNTQAPNCVLTASPAQVVANQKSNLQVVCRPLAGGTATPYVWSATAEAGSPTPPSPPAATSSSGEITFANAGTFTFRIRGQNAIGSGPMASATVTVAAPPPPPAPSQFLNASFEAPTVPAGTYVSPWPSGTDWVPFGGSYKGIMTNGYATSVAYPLAADGVQYPFIPTDGGVRQTLSLAPGTYTISYSAMVQAGQAGVGVKVSANGTVLQNVTPPAAAWGRYSATLSVPTAGNQEIDFASSSPGAGTYFYLDYIRLALNGAAAVPNGSFETPIVAGAYVTPLPTSSGWTATGSYNGILTNSHALSAGYPIATDGNQYPWISADGSVYQSVTLPAGTYTFSFNAMVHSTSVGLGVVLRINGQPQPVANAPAVAWGSYSHTVTLSGGSTEIKFTAGSPGIGGNFYIDNVRVVGP